MPVVAKLSEVPNLGKKLVTVAGQEVLLVNYKGNIYAVENECPHQGSPLAGAMIKDGHLSCPRHGYRFELNSGACKDFPEFVLKSWPVRIEGDDIIVDLA